MVLSAYLWMPIVGGFAAFVMGFGIGANDVSNSIGSSVGSAAMKLKYAILLGCIFEFVGSVGFGATVTNAVRRNIIDLEAYSEEIDVVMLGNLCAVVVSGIWMVSASRVGLPVSCTQSIVGALVGFGLVTHPAAVNWTEVGRIIISWFVSPLLAAAVSGLLFVTVRHFILRKDDATERGVRALWILVLLLCITFMLFFNLKNPMILNNVACPQPDEDGNWVKTKPCKVKTWVSGNLWKTIGISIGIGIGFAIIFTPLAYWIAKRIIKKYDDSKDSEVSHLEAQEDWESGKMSFTSTLSKRTASTADSTQGSQKGNWLQQTWSRMPWNKDLLETTLEGDKHIQLMHRSVEEFDPRVEAFFCFLQVVSAACACLVHGSNDVANATAPFASILSIYKTGSLENSVDTPAYLLAFGGFAICVGLSFYSYRVIQAVGIGLTRITPSRGFCIELGTAFVIIIASVSGLPVSTSHCQVGSTVAVGMLDKVVEGDRTTCCGWLKLNAVNWKLVLRISVIWLSSLFIVSSAASAITAFAAYSPTKVSAYYIADGPWIQ